VLLCAGKDDARIKVRAVSATLINLGVICITGVDNLPVGTQMLHASMFLNCKQRNCRVIAALAFTVTCLLADATTLCFAQESAKGATEKWRPKDGLYASPDKDFEMQCGEFGELVISLSEKSVGGNEWSCKINRLTDTAPSSVKLDITCDDYNLALSIDGRDPNAYERKFKEVMLLKRINDTSISVRKTLNGQFKGPSWQADYCPEDVQRMRIEQTKRTMEDAKYKIPEQLSRPNQWRPKDGIYASTGPDFGDRCTKSGDVAIGLVDGSISSGKAQCKVVEVMNTGQAAMSLSMTCNQPSAKPPSSPAKKGSEANSRREAGTLSMDVIRMSRIDDNTFHMQKTVDRKFRDDGGPVAYCPEDAQRAYAARTAKK
jgi:hypothetical protein